MVFKEVEGLILTSMASPASLHVMAEDNTGI